MKKIFLLSLSLLSLTASAQDTYINDRLVNNSHDVIGSARYVGMGGALGALGADLSTISWNPAGIGLYRKNDVSMTFGGTWGKSRIESENPGKATFDQMGFVYSMETGSETCPYFNFAFNYQKKINFNNNYYADHDKLKNLSQLDQMAELCDFDDGTQYNLAALVLENNLLTKVVDDKGIRYRNDYSGKESGYAHHSEGSLQGYDFNFSTSIKNRAYVGLTIGVDNMRYYSGTLYEELNNNGTKDSYYSISNDVAISGYGFNVKLGAIVRPIEDNPFRIGFVVETPTWYRLKNSTFFDIGDIEDNVSDLWESYLEYTLRTPWKVRTSIGSTIGKCFAWDVDYEFANYGATSMGYPKYDDYYDGTSFSSYKDLAMNRLTKQTLRGTHTLRAGAEVRPISKLAFRLGYNFISSSYKDNVAFDQYPLAYEGSLAANYSTNTSYMRLGATNIITLGVGFRSKYFYADLAYKVRNQKGDFYAFDTSYTDANSNSMFIKENPELVDVHLDPVDVNLTRQTVIATLGFKF